MTLMKKAVCAAIMSVALAGTAYAGDSFKKMDAGYWSRVDLQTVIVYDWSMRNRYLVTMTEECAAMNNGKGARLAATWYGRIDGSFKDRMIFGNETCNIDTVERLSKKQFASLQQDKDIQMAALSPE